MTQPGFMIREGHFQHLPDADAAKSLFKQSVRFVEIEIHSFCNRTCSFCPNSFIDRRTRRTIVDPALYTKVMDDLASIDYDGVVWYSRYNEPTADRPLFLERLREARAKLPCAKLQTFTNGDYLTAEYIAAIRDAGLNELCIMAYLPDGQEPTMENFTALLEARLKKLGLPWYLAAPNRAEVGVSGMHVTCGFEDFTKIGTNRGGSLKTGAIINRTSPCLVPFLDVYIDHNGAMVPCCDIRSDYEPHKPCVVYTLTPENSIFDGYANSQLVLWRLDLARFGEKKFPCNSCSRRTYPETPQLAAMFAEVAAAADRIAKEGA